MNTQVRLIAAAVAALAMGQVSAQSQTYDNSGYARSSNYGYGHSQVVRCESVRSRRTYCGVGTSGTVRLTRQLSHSACIQGRTWSADSRGIWVSNGCRAEFSINARRNYRGNDGYASNGNGYYRDNGSRYGNQPEYQYGNDRYGNGDYPNSSYRDGNYNNGYGNSTSQVIRCDSTRDGRTYCRNESNGIVRLNRTYGGRCTEGQTWGSDGQGIWVSGDCAASFNIDNSSDYDSNYNTNNDPDYYQR
jgi:hypothetical protein